MYEYFLVSVCLARVGYTILGNSMYLCVYVNIYV